MLRGIMIALFVLTLLTLFAMLRHDPLFDENYRYTARKDVQLILDGPEVQRLLSEESGNIADREASSSLRPIDEMIEFHQHPERYIPKHLEFLRAINAQPAEMVPEGSHARVLKSSKAQCGRIPDSDIYAYFRVTTGPMKSREGWACMSGDFAPVLVWP